MNGNDDYKRFSCAQTAKLVREALKENFQNVKFSVTSKTYSGGASIRVEWRDGPAVALVDKVVEPYRGADFDGMQDLKTSRDNTDPQTGEKVSYGADFIFCNRDFSSAFYTPFANETAREWGLEAPVIEVSEYDGGAVAGYNTYLDNRESLCSMIRHKLENVSEAGTVKEKPAKAVASAPALALVKPLVLAGPAKAVSALGTGAPAKVTRRGWLNFGENGLTLEPEIPYTIHAGGWYYFGASSSPDLVKIVALDDKWATYIRYEALRHNELDRTVRTERSIAEHLIAQGNKTRGKALDQWEKGQFNDPAHIEQQRRQLATGVMSEEDLQDLDQAMAFNELCDLWPTLRGNAQQREYELARALRDDSTLADRVARLREMGKPFEIDLKWGTWAEDPSTVAVAVAVLDVEADPSVQAARALLAEISVSLALDDNTDGAGWEDVVNEREKAHYTALDAEEENRADREFEAENEIDLPRTEQTTYSGGALSVAQAQIDIIDNLIAFPLWYVDQFHNTYTVKDINFRGNEKYKLDLVEERLGHEGARDSRVYWVFGHEKLYTVDARQARIAAAVAQMEAAEKRKAEQAAAPSNAKKSPAELAEDIANRMHKNFEYATNAFEAMTRLNLNETGRTHTANNVLTWMHELNSLYDIGLSLVGSDFPFHGWMMDARDLEARAWVIMLPLDAQPEIIGLERDMLDVVCGKSPITWKLPHFSDEAQAAIRSLQDRGFVRILDAGLVVATDAGRDMLIKLSMAETE